jgi:thiol-disulfide isomerase/thioredoxin
MIGETQAQALRWPEHSVLKWSQSNKALTHDPPMGRVILADGEVSAAKLVAIDSNGLSFSTPWSATTTMPHEQVRALRLLDGAAQRTGFADKGWAVSGKDGAVVLKNSGGADTHEVQINVGGTLFHPSMMTGSDITFHIKTDYGGLQIDCCAAEAQDGKATKVMIWKSGNQIYAVDAANAANGVRNDQMLRNVDQRADVRVALKTSGKEVVVRVNDVDLLRLPFVDAQRRSTGIAFHTGSMWGNQQRPVTITHFRVENSMPVLAPLGVNSVARAEALTVPRFRRDRLPKQVLVATNGDVIRGEVEAATDHALRFAIGLESHDVPMERIDSIVWTQRPNETPPKALEEKPMEKAAEKPRMRVVRQSTPVVAKVTIPRKPVPAPSAPAPGLMRWLTLRDGSRIALKEAMFGAENVGAVSAALGAMKLRTEELAGMQWSASGPAPDLREFTDWQLVRAPEPVLPETGGASSPLLGKEAPTFVLPLLSGGKFDLKATRGHVVVLDFWATWCGPCVSSLPQLLADVKPFGDKVQLIGVNQGEAAKVIQKFIEQRKWELNVALDGDQSIAAKYAVEGIPHTVIIDKTGKVSWVHVGYEANGSAKFIEALNAALK